MFLVCRLVPHTPHSANAEVASCRSPEATAEHLGEMEDNRLDRPTHIMRPSEPTLVILVVVTGEEPERLRETGWNRVVPPRHRDGLAISVVSSGPGTPQVWRVEMG
jgi:hypothetical protein